MKTRHVFRMSELMKPWDLSLFTQNWSGNWQQIYDRMCTIRIPSKMIYIFHDTYEKLKTQFKLWMSYLPTQQGSHHRLSSRDILAILEHEAFKNLKHIASKDATA